MVMLLFEPASFAVRRTLRFTLPTDFIMLSLYCRRTLQ